MSGTILCAEDDPVQQILLRKLLEKNLPYDVLAVNDGEEAIEVLSGDKTENIILAILDVEMPNMGGLEVLKIMREQYPSIPVLMLTASEEIGDAVKAMKLGATDFISKPPHPTHLKVSIINAIKMQSLQNEVTRLKRTQEGIMGFSDLIGYETGLASMVTVGQKAAISDVPVLITGETGVGKELFAQAVHGESRRVGGAFIAVNCGAIPKGLVESTLFGHEKGAFTGAVNRSIGKFREAEGGTIFLDEVGELPLDAQVKLLRVLQQHEVEPVGAGRSVPINVRIISATNRDLEEEVREERFREDLFFRLDVLPIHVPPLRERPEDIPVLANYFIEQFAVADNLPAKQLSDGAVDMLKQHPWPGNVRALQNSVRRALILSEGEKITAEDFAALREVEPGDSEEVMASPYGVSLLDQAGSFKTVDAIELEVMQKALEFYKHNVTRAAEALGMAKSTFYKKAERYGLK